MSARFQPGSSLPTIYCTTNCFRRHTTCATSYTTYSGGDDKKHTWRGISGRMRSTHCALECRSTRRGVCNNAVSYMFIGVWLRADMHVEGFCNAENV